MSTAVAPPANAAGNAETLTIAGATATIVQIEAREPRTQHLITTAELRGGQPQDKRITFSEHPDEASNAADISR